ncbi:alpha/beta fold hydrolase [Micromonospora sp. DT81.3]|uniref:alpha/beta fold hydrolase n=1 Tax=Micromonospora sp. DT81.3 TaxID=3416523 RepID=UPI003CF304CD
MRDLSSPSSPQGDSDSWAHSPHLQQRIAPETTYCEYERVNVGDSAKVQGPLSVTDTVADLRGLIERLGLATPVVLVGGSFGGLIAYTYAGTHPEDVAGVVLLDPTLPSEDEIERALLPESMWLPPTHGRPRASRSTASARTPSPASRSTAFRRCRARSS